MFSVLDRELPVETHSSHYFEQNLEAKLDQPTTRDLEVWIAHTEPLIQQGLAEAAQATGTAHLDTHDYFLPHATQTSHNKTTHK